MTAYFFRRTLWLVPIMLVVIVIASLLLQVTPRSLGGEREQAGSRAAPVMEVLFGSPDGGSFWDSPSGNSIRLIALALAIAVSLGIPWGVLAAIQQDTWLEGALGALSEAAISLPGFLLASLVAALTALWRYPAGAGVETRGLAAWALPAAVLAFGVMGYTARLLRTALRQVGEQGYALSAHAKGLPVRRVFTRHLFRNALIPLSSMLGPALSSLMAGSLLVEAVFDFPGMGAVFVGAIQQGDRPLIMAGVAAYAFLAALASLAADLLAALLDPRLRPDER